MAIEKIKKSDKYKQKTKINSKKKKKSLNF